VDGTYPALANRGGVDSLGLKRRRGEELHESCRPRPPGLVSSLRDLRIAQLVRLTKEVVRLAGHVGLHPEVGVTAREVLWCQCSSERRYRGGLVDERPKGAATRYIDLRVGKARIGITEADRVIHRQV
jgi:hypothetical protein